MLAKRRESDHWCSACVFMMNGPAGLILPRIFDGLIQRLRNSSFCVEVM